MVQSRDYGNGFNYQMKSYEVTMIEFHIDDNEIYLVYVDKKYPEFGGCVSVRVPQGEKPIIVLW